MTQNTTTEEKYFLQDSRQVVGNDLLFWRQGRAGYTTNIDEAHVFTLEEALSHRKTDVPWPVEYIRSISRPAVDHQRLAYEYHAQRKLMVAKLKEAK